MEQNITQTLDDLIKHARWEDAAALAAANPTQDSRACFLAGVACFNLGNLRDAEAYFRKAQALEDAQYQLGLVLFKQRRAAEAVDVFRDLCARNPEHALGRLHWGMALLELNNVPDALAHFEEATQLSPGPAGWYQCALAGYRLGKYDEAARLFKKAASADPQFWEAVHGQALCMVALGGVPEGLRLFRDAFSLAPQSGELVRSWASVLFSAGEHEQADQLYDSVLRAGVTHETGIASAGERARLYNDWGLSLLRRGHFEDAMEKLLQSVDIDPGFNEACVNLGIAEMMLQEFDRAAESFEKCIKAEPDLADAYFFYGVVRLLQKRYEDMEEKFLQAERASRAARVPSGHGAARSGDLPSRLNLWRGYASIAQKNAGAGKHYFEKCLAKNAADFLALDGMGIACAALGDYDGAQGFYQRALQSNPTFALARLHLSRCLAHKGEQAQARSAYEQAVFTDPRCLAAEKEALEELLRQAQYETALQRAANILEVVPKDLAASLAAIRAHKAMGRLEECERLLVALLSSFPKDPTTNSMLGEIYYAQTRLSDADERFRLALQCGNIEVSAYCAWGMTLMKLGLYELALEKFEKAALVDPYYADTYDAWGTALKALGRFAEASEVFKRATEYV